MFTKPLDLLIVAAVEPKRAYQQFLNGRHDTGRAIRRLRFGFPPANIVDNHYEHISFVTTFKTEQSYWYSMYFFLRQQCLAMHQHVCLHRHRRLSNICRPVSIPEWFTWRTK